MREKKKKREKGVRGSGERREKGKEEGEVKERNNLTAPQVGGPKGGIFKCDIHNLVGEMNKIGRKLSSFK